MRGELGTACNVHNNSKLGTACNVHNNTTEVTMLYEVGQVPPMNYNHTIEVNMLYEVRYVTHVMLIIAPLRSTCCTRYGILHL